MRLISVLSLSALLTSGYVLACEGEHDGKTPKAAATGAGLKTANLPTADALVKKHLSAMGGYDTLKAATTQTFTMVDKETGDRTVVYHMRPNLMRKEIHKGGQVTVKAFDGQTGWSAEGNAQPVIMPATDSAMMANYAEFDDPLVDFAKRGIKVAVLGSEEVRGAPAYKIQITHKDGAMEDRWLDQKNLFEVKRVVNWTKEGKPMSKTIYFGDYRKVDGIYVNQVVEYEYEGKQKKMAVTDISYKRSLNLALFQKPANARLASR